MVDWDDPARLTSLLAGRVRTRKQNDPLTTTHFAHAYQKRRKRLALGLTKRRYRNEAAYGTRASRENYP